MLIEVSNDRTVRTIAGTVQVTGPEYDIDVTRRYHRKPRIFRPDMFVLTLVDGEPDWIQVYGGLVLKSGAASQRVREKAEWRHRQFIWDVDRIESAPEWVRLIWDAPYVRGGKIGLFGADAADVQPL